MKKNKLINRGIIVAVLLFIFLMVVIGGAKTRFAKGTMLGNFDVSGKNKKEILEQLESYKLTVVYLDENGEDARETIKGTDFAFTIDGEKVGELLKKQSILDYVTGNGEKQDMGTIR